LNLASVKMLSTRNGTTIATFFSHNHCQHWKVLAKRHRSKEAEYVRHIDTAETRVSFPLVLVLGEMRFGHASNSVLNLTYSPCSGEDNLRSAANVGSIFRSADACGCSEVVSSGSCAQAVAWESVLGLQKLIAVHSTWNAAQLTTGITPHPRGNGAEKLSKSSLGAERIVPSQHFSTTLHAVEWLRRERPNLRLIGMETTEHSKIYTNVTYPGPRIAKERDGNVKNSPGVALFLGECLQQLASRIDEPTRIEILLRSRTEIRVS